MPGLADLMGGAPPQMPQPQAQTQPAQGPMQMDPRVRQLLMAWYQLVQQGTDPQQAISVVAQQFGVQPQMIAGLIQQVTASQQSGGGGGAPGGMMPGGM